MPPTSHEIRRAFIEHGVMNLQQVVKKCALFFLLSVCLDGVLMILSFIKDSEDNCEYIMMET